MDPCALVRQILDPVQIPTAHLFVTFEHLFDSKILSKERIYPTKEDEMILVESIVRHYLDCLRSIDSDQSLHSTCSSSIDLFLFNEYTLMKKFSNDLYHRMNYLLEVFTRVEVPLSETNLLIRSILYDSTIANFVRNYQFAFEQISKTNSNNINLRFIRRRKQLLQLMHSTLR